MSDLNEAQLTQLYEDWTALGAKRERERINGIIDQFIENSDYPEVVSCLEWLQDVIKGESKKPLWTERPWTEEDDESYGIKGEK
jgi:hypothetical protein